MTLSPNNHHWTGKHAELFVRTMEKQVNQRYRPFAKQIATVMENHKISKISKILDIGCGPGLLLLEIKKIIPNINLMGIDPSEYMLDAAKKKFKEYHFNQLEVKQGFAENIPLPKESVEVTVCLNSLHDFKDAKKTIEEVYRVLRGDGIFILRDRNGAIPKWKRKQNFLFRSIRYGMKETRKYFRSAPRWLNPQNVKNWMENSGFLVEIKKQKVEYLIIGMKK